MNQVKKNPDNDKLETNIVDGEVIHTKGIKNIESYLASVESTYFAGPLPHPDVLKQYDNIVPGAANRIIQMAESQSKHRRDLEKKVIGSNIVNERIGMIFAFILTVLLLFFSGTLIYMDKPIEGLITLGIVIIGNAYNYISQKKQEKEGEYSPKEDDLKK